MAVGSGQHFVGGDTLGTNPAAGSYRLAYTAAGVPFLQDSAGVQYFLPGNKGADIVIGSAGATLTPPVLSNYVQVSFTTPASHTIAAIAATYVGKRITMAFTTAGSIIHSASLILPGAANITTYAGLVLTFAEESAGVWRCIGGISLPIMGITDGSNAAAGVVGEVIRTATYTYSSPLSLTTGTVANLGSIVLTAGVWLISGAGNISYSGNSTVSILAASKTSATLPGIAIAANPAAGEAYSYDAYPSGAVGQNQMTIPAYEYNFSGANVTLYFVVRATFSTGTANGFGYLEARRIR